MNLFKSLSTPIKLLFFTFCLLILSKNVYANENEHEKGVYAQLSSTTTQLSGVTTKSIILENVDAHSKVHVDHNHVTVQEPGTYVISVTAGVGAQGLNLSGNVYMWLAKNGAPIPNAYISQRVSNNSINNFSLQTILPLKNGDTISVIISATNPSIGIISTISQSPDHSIIPSAIFSIFKLESR